MKEWRINIDLGCSAQDHKFKNSLWGTRSAWKISDRVRLTEDLYIRIITTSAKYRPELAVRKL